MQGLISRADAVRLVTVTGPGGVGKTRLALAAAESVADRFADGVFFVRLAPVPEMSVMWTTIAEVLGITGDGRSPATFFEHIADLQALLVLDNLEQLPLCRQAESAGDRVECLVALFSLTDLCRLTLAEAVGSLVRTDHDHRERHPR